MASRQARPAIIGPDAGPQAPYPVRMEGPVISGFGRGSKELGIPTANLPVDPATTPWIADCVSGVYFGWARLGEPTAADAEAAQAAEAVQAAAKAAQAAQAAQAGTASVPASAPVSASPPSTASVAGLYPMVMSIGFNPFYGNTTRTAEVHILHRFARDFYGAPLRLAILGYVRPELDYVSVDALIDDIRTDCAVAQRSLARPAWTPAGVTVAAADAADEADEGKGQTKTTTTTATATTAMTNGSAVQGTLDIPWLA